VPDSLTTSPLAAAPPVLPALLGASFAERFRQGPEEAIDWLRQTVRATASPGQDSAAVLLPYLANASYAQQNLVFAALRELATPQEVLGAALAAARPGEGAGLLKPAAAVLEALGQASWPALQQLADSGRPEYRYFVATIATFPEVSEEARRQALLGLTHNPDLDTRREVLEALEGGALAEPRSVWQALARDEDEEIRDLAATRLASLTD
jgi:hypothetical protein